MKQKQVTLYEVLEVLAKAWISNVPGYYIHDDSDSMYALEGYERAFDRISSELKHPSSMNVFVKAYLKKEYIAAVKSYLTESNDDFEEYAANLPIKISQKDYDAA